MKHYIGKCKVNTSFKMKHIGADLDKLVWTDTTKKHNELVTHLCWHITDLYDKIERLEKRLDEPKKLE